MRDKLVRDIKKKFGSVYGSEQLKAQRQEIITNALDRYDEEIQNGASEMHAYHMAYESIGDVKKLRKEIATNTKVTDQSDQKNAELYDRYARGRDAKKNIRIAIVIVAVSTLLLVTAAVVSACSGIWLVFIGFLIAVVLTGTSLWKIITKEYLYLVPNIICAVIGGTLLLIFGLFLYAIGWMLMDSKIESYDYTSQSAQVLSIELVKLETVSVHNDATNDEFQYTVVKALDESQWDKLLKDCARLKYRDPVFKDHIYLYDDTDEKIIIQFANCNDDCFRVFYGALNPGYLQETEGGFTVHYYVKYCNDNEWKAILKNYFDYTP